MSGSWRHNDAERRWECGYYSAPDLPRDDPGGDWHWAGYITDEHMERTAMTPEQLAVWVFNRFGSAPPPLAVHLPDAEPPVLFEVPPAWPDGQPVTPWADPGHDVIGDIRRLHDENPPGTFP